jgi:hypothetical protein
MADDWIKFPMVGMRVYKKGEEATLMHVIMSWSWKHQQEVMLREKSIQMVMNRSTYAYVSV